MPDIAAANVTITANQQDRVQVGRYKMGIVKIQFGDASLTVPAGGAVPLPAIGYFGMNKELTALIVYGGKGPYEFSFDKANHTLIVYYGDYSASADGVHANAATVAIAAQTLYALAIGR